MSVVVQPVCQLLVYDGRIDVRLKVDLFEQKPELHVSQRFKLSETIFIVAGLLCVVYCVRLECQLDGRLAQSFFVRVVKHVVAVAGKALEGLEGVLGQNLHNLVTLTDLAPNAWNNFQRFVAKTLALIAGYELA